MHIADFFAAKLGHIARHHKARTFDLLFLLLKIGFLLGLAQIVAIQHIKTASLLQMRCQNGFGLATQTIVIVGKHTTHIAGTVIKFTDRNRRALSHKLGIGGGHFFDWQSARLFGGTGRQSSG